MKPDRIDRQAQFTRRLRIAECLKQRCRLALLADAGDSDAVEDVF